MPIPYYTPPDYEADDTYTLLDRWDDRIAELDVLIAEIDKELESEGN